jgi:putative oxidoreductase
MDVLFLVGRIVFGGYFVMSGLNHFTKFRFMTGYAQSKGTPAPAAAVAGTGILLVLGGLSFLLGVEPIIGGALLIVFLLGASFKIHDFWTVKDPQMKMAEVVNFTKNMALLGGILILMSRPVPWPYSL